jgi:hypothetical protein
MSALDFQQQAAELKARKKHFQVVRRAVHSVIFSLSDNFALTFLSSSYFFIENTWGGTGEEKKLASFRVAAKI